jgi:hypothetical protein
MDEERRRRLLLNYDRLLGGHLVGNVDHKLEDYALSTWLLLRMFRENIGYVRLFNFRYSAIKIQTC